MRSSLLFVLRTISLATATSATALGDFGNLQLLVQNTSTQMNNSIITPVIHPNASSNATIWTNVTYGPAYTIDFPTATTLANIMIAIWNSQAGCDANQTTFVNNESQAATDAAYLNYVDALFTLAQVLTTRGKLAHSEWNQPVWNNIASLATAVHAYGTDLTARSIISRFSTIRTITADGALVDAQSAWAMGGALPGKKARRRQ